MKILGGWLALISLGVLFRFLPFTGWFPQGILEYKDIFAMFSGFCFGVSFLFISRL